MIDRAAAAAPPHTRSGQRRGRADATEHVTAADHVTAAAAPASDVTAGNISWDKSQVYSAYARARTPDTAVRWVSATHR